MIYWIKWQTREENGKSPEQIVQELGAYLEERGF